MRNVAVEGHPPTRVATAPVVEGLARCHLTAKCATELDGGPACPACLAYRLRAYGTAGDARGAVDTAAQDPAVHDRLGDLRTFIRRRMPS
jgi:hypothetical protein